MELYISSSSLTPWLSEEGQLWSNVVTMSRVPLEELTLNFTSGAPENVYFSQDLATFAVTQIPVGNCMYSDASSSSPPNRLLLMLLFISYVLSFLCIHL
jgi:hypothetical protein